MSNLADFERVMLDLSSVASELEASGCDKSIVRRIRLARVTADHVMTELMTPSRFRNVKPPSKPRDPPTPPLRSLSPPLHRAVTIDGRTFKVDNRLTMAPVAFRPPLKGEYYAPPPPRTAEAS